LNITNIGFGTDPQVNLAILQNMEQEVIPEIYNTKQKAESYFQLQECKDVEVLFEKIDQLYHFVLEQTDFSFSEMQKIRSQIYRCFSTNQEVIQNFMGWKIQGDFLFFEFERLTAKIDSYFHSVRPLLAYRVIDDRAAYAAHYSALITAKVMTSSLQKTFVENCQIIGNKQFIASKRSDLLNKYALEIASYPQIGLVANLEIGDTCHFHTTGASSCKYKDRALQCTNLQVGPGNDPSGCYVDVMMIRGRRHRIEFTGSILGGTGRVFLSYFCDDGHVFKDIGTIPTDHRLAIFLPEMPNIREDFVQVRISFLFNDPSEPNQVIQIKKLVVCPYAISDEFYLGYPIAKEIDL